MAIMEQTRDNVVFLIRSANDERCVTTHLRLNSINERLDRLNAITDRVIDDIKKNHIHQPERK